MAKKPLERRPSVSRRIWRGRSWGKNGYAGIRVRSGLLTRNGGTVSVGRKSLR